MMIYASEFCNQEMKNPACLNVFQELAWLFMSTSKLCIEVIEHIRVPFREKKEIVIVLKNFVLSAVT
jgi:hypothetical protein